MQVPTVPYPFVLKPCCEDNSMGISKVENASELPAALAEAFKFDSVVVCEAFIPLGREIRLAVVEDEHGEPTTVLPATEYLLTPEHPMRLSTDKISVTDQGLPDADKFFATNREEAPTTAARSARRRSTRSSRLSWPTRPSARTGRCAAATSPSLTSVRSTAPHPCGTPRATHHSTRHSRQPQPASRADPLRSFA